MSDLKETDPLANTVFKIGDCIQIDNNNKNNENNRNGDIYLIEKVSGNETDYGLHLRRWEGNDCNINGEPSSNSWSAGEIYSFYKNNTIMIGNSKNSFKIVDRPDLGEWKKKGSWKKSDGVTILTIDNVEYKVGDCCKIDLGNKMNRFKSFGIDGPIHDAIICEFPTIESNREITEFDFMKFYFFKPNFSERFNLNKFKNREIFIKIKLSLMEIFINGFIKNKIECPKYDLTQIKLITGGKRSRKVKKQRKSKKKEKSRSRK
jgi:hypothetical protein